MAISSPLSASRTSTDCDVQPRRAHAPPARHFRLCNERGNPRGETHSCSFPTLTSLNGRGVDEICTQFRQQNLGPAFDQQRDKIANLALVKSRVGRVDQRGHSFLRHCRIFAGEPLDHLSDKRPLARLSHAIRVASFMSVGQKPGPPSAPHFPTAELAGLTLGGRRVPSPSRSCDPVSVTGGLHKVSTLGVNNRLLVARNSYSTGRDT